MALPQQVVEQLSREGSPHTPGWSFGIMLFSGSLLLIVVLIYGGLRFGYEPYLTGQMNGLKGQVDNLGQSISPADEANIVTFYSQISNLQSLVKNHVIFSQFFDWLEKNTEANVYYNTMSFTSGNQAMLAGNAKTSADVPEQVAIFETSPEVSSVLLSNVSYSAAANDWTFNITLTLRPDLLHLVPGAAMPVVSSTAPAAAASTSTSAPLPAFGASSVNSVSATGTATSSKP